MTPASRPKPWHLALLMALAAILSTVAWRSFQPALVPGYSDYWDYLQLARQLASGEGFSSLFSYPLFLPASGDAAMSGNADFPMLWRPPLYPVLLAGTFFFTGGPSAWAPVVLQVAGYLLSILATYFLALEFSGRRWALLSGLVVALSPALLGLEEPGIVTALYTAGLALAVRAVVRAAGRREAARAGAFFGLLSLLRGEALLLYPAMIWLLWAGERGDRERRIWTFLAAAVAVSLPWMLRNWLVTGRPFFGTSSLVYIDTRDFPGWISSRMTGTLDRSAFLWALGHMDQVGWKGLRNFYHFLTQGLLLPLPALAPFAWAAVGRLTRVGKESAYCAAVLIALVLTMLLLAPLEYSPRFLHPFIPLVTVVGVIMLDRIREQVGEGESARYSRRPALWVAAAVVALAALQLLGALRDARRERGEWRRNFGPLAATDWGAVARRLPADDWIEADYPAYYAWHTGRRFVWSPADAGRPLPPGRDGGRLALLARGRGESVFDPTGIEPTVSAAARADSVVAETGGVILLWNRAAPGHGSP